MLKIGDICVYTRKADSDSPRYLLLLKRDGHSWKCLCLNTGRIKYRGVRYLKVHWHVHRRNQNDR